MTRDNPTRTRRHLRFLAQVVIAVVLFTWAPTIAQAAFSSASVAPVTVGTLKIPVPTGVSASGSCPFLNPVLTVNITGVGPVSRATSYTATLTPQGASSEGPEQTLAGNRTGTLTIPRAYFTSPTATLRIRAHVNSWVGDPFVATVSC